MEYTCEVIKAAMKVHSALGAGLFEEVYKVSLKHELQKAGFKVQSEATLPLVYDGIEFNVASRIDLLVNNYLILEQKSVQQIIPIHKTQLITYLILSKKELELILKFNCTHLKNGIKRIINSKNHSATIASSALHLNKNNN